MEIRDPIHGTLEISDAEAAVLDSPAFQRLRSIKQLGFAEFSFPGATHNRFLHSLGACHLAGLAFDNIFKNHKFQKPKNKEIFKQCVKLAALLHDSGHGPLSHTTEEVMPDLKELNIKLYPKIEKRRANHEDYTIKFVTDSSLSQTLKKNFTDIEPIHIASLIDKTISLKDDFFVDGTLNFRTLLGQLVSSELDVDRMDYLGRDSYFCGTNYGKVELSWLIANLTYHLVDGQFHLALNRRALYAFDDFLVSRHHMYLMVYFHHKAIIYDEMLYLYLTSKNCDYQIPADINKYLSYTDPHIYQHMKKSDNVWAQRISKHEPFKMLFEMHTTGDSPRSEKLTSMYENEKIEVILASSEARLSKYHSLLEQDPSRQIFIVDQYDKKSEPITLEKGTEIFQKYEKARRIERLYVAPEKYDKAKVLLDGAGI